MFVPLRSKTLVSSRAAVAAHQYSMWAIKALRAASGSGESDAPSKPTTKVPAVKKATATDTATARMQLDAAAAQAAAMAIRLQREKHAAAELEAGEDGGDALHSVGTNINNNNVIINQQQLNDLDKNDPIGGLHALDDFETDSNGDYAPGILGDFTDDFEGMNSNIDENGDIINTLEGTATNNGALTRENEVNIDDYSGADDFKAGGAGTDAGDGAVLEAAEDDYHHRAQKLEENPFGDDDVDGTAGGTGLLFNKNEGQNAAAHAAGVARKI